jgi:hypothetical protein
MTRDQPRPIKPPSLPDDDADGFLRNVRNIIAVTKAAASPAIKPDKDLRKDGAPHNGTPKGPGT